MENLDVVILGITGNLAQIKLIPALYDLEAGDYFPKGSRIFGIGRKLADREEFEKYVKGVLRAKNRHHTHEIDEKVEDRLLKKLEFVQGDFKDDELYAGLVERLQAKERVFYLATYPNLYEGIFKKLAEHKLVIRGNNHQRLMIEKPIGSDLKSAQQINKMLLTFFAEEQIYRLDHYLGKETLQNILTFRYGNGIFEPIINKDYVDHVQITAAEDFGVGQRGNYYDVVGALKDVGQNHLLQMAALALMKAPRELNTTLVGRERIRILKTFKPVEESLILGQYEGYSKEANVGETSQTDTYFAFKGYLDNSRFAGVPIYIRGGKMLKQTATEISIVFKNHSLKSFNQVFNPAVKKNILVYRVAPNEGIVLKILAKTPGEKMKAEEAYMQFCYKDLASDLPDPYERLIQDALEGDLTFFNNAAEVEAEWEIIEKLLKHKTKVQTYKSGSWGPKAADEMIKADGREWLEPSEAFCRI